MFRMPRDDDYMRTLLTVVSRLYTEHVLLSQPPPTDGFSGWDVYAQLLSRTTQLAREAVLLTHLTAPAFAAETEARLFCD